MSQEAGGRGRRFHPSPGQLVPSAPRKSVHSLRLVHSFNKHIPSAAGITECHCEPGTVLGSQVTREQQSKIPLLWFKRKRRIKEVSKLPHLGTGTWTRGLPGQIRGGGKSTGDAGAAQTSLLHQDPKMVTFCDKSLE